MTERPENLVAVNEDIESAGAIFWWKLSGDADGETFNNALKEAGLQGTILTPTAHGALERACRRVIGRGAKGSRTLVRPLGNRIPGFAIVDEEAVEDGKNLDHGVRFTVTVDPTNDAISVEQYADSGQEEAQIERIRAEFKRCRDRVDATAFAAWLPTMAKTHGDAVGLRPGGGIYFVPRPAMAQWKTLLDVITDHTDHKVYEVPAMDSDEAVDAILDAVLAEASAEAEAMEAELAKGGLKSRALETRKQKTTALKKKIERYEKLLGAKTIGIHEALDALAANLGAATLGELEIPEIEGVG